MQQFNHKFIDAHLLPFMEQILIDTAQSLRPYHRNLILRGSLTQDEEKMFIQDYFQSHPNSDTIPFTKTSQAVQRHDFIKYFCECIRTKSTHPVERWRMLMPIQDKEHPELFHWPANVKHALTRMAYDIAHSFEKKRIGQLIKRKEKINPKDAARDKKLNKRGMLMLVKTPGGKRYDRYLTKNDIGTISSATPLITPPSAKTKALLRFRKGSTEMYETFVYGTDMRSIVPQEVSFEQLTELFEERREEDIPHILALQGLEVLNSNALGWLIRSEDHQIQVKVKEHTPLDQELVFDFQFLNGRYAGEEFELLESQLEDFFTREDASKRTLEAAYEKLITEKQRKRLFADLALMQHAPAEEKDRPLVVDTLPVRFEVQKSDTLQKSPIRPSHRAKEFLFEPKTLYPTTDTFHREGPIFSKPDTYSQEKFSFGPKPIIPGKTTMDQKKRLLQKRKVTSSPFVENLIRQMQMAGNVQTRQNTEKKLTALAQPKQSFLQKHAGAIAGGVIGGVTAGTFTAGGLFSYFKSLGVF